MSLLSAYRRHNTVEFKKILNSRKSTIKEFESVFHEALLSSDCVYVTELCKYYVHHKITSELIESLSKQDNVTVFQYLREQKMIKYHQHVVFSFCIRNKANKSLTYLIDSFESNQQTENVVECCLKYNRFDIVLQIISKINIIYFSEKFLDISIKYSNFEAVEYFMKISKIPKFYILNKLVLIHQSYNLFCVCYEKWKNDEGISWNSIIESLISKKRYSEIVMMRDKIKKENLESYIWYSLRYNDRSILDFIYWFYWNEIKVDPIVKIGITQRSKDRFLSIGYLINVGIGSNLDCLNLIYSYLIPNSNYEILIRCEPWLETLILPCSVSSLKDRWSVSNCDLLFHRLMHVFEKLGCFNLITNE